MALPAVIAEREPTEAMPVRVQPAARLVLSANALFLLFVGILPQSLMVICAVAVQRL